MVHQKGAGKLHGVCEELRLLINCFGDLMKKKLLVTIQSPQQASDVPISN